MSATDYFEGCFRVVIGDLQCVYDWFEIVNYFRWLHSPVSCFLVWKKKTQEGIEWQTLSWLFVWPIGIKVVPFSNRDNSSSRVLGGSHNHPIECIMFFFCNILFDKYILHVSALCPKIVNFNLHLFNTLVIAIEMDINLNVFELYTCKSVDWSQNSILVLAISEFREQTIQINTT